MQKKERAVPRSFGICRAVVALLALSASIARADFLVVDGLIDEIARFSDGGVRKGTFVTPGSGGMNSPFSMTFGPDGNLYVAGSHGLYAYHGQTGEYLRTLPISFPVPPNLLFFGIRFAPNGDLLISSGAMDTIYRADPVTGRLIAQIKHPLLDSPGKMLELPDGGMIVASSGNNKLLTLDLETNTVAGVFAEGGGLLGPFGMRYGPDGMIYVGNLYGDAGIRRVDPATGQVLGLFAADPGNRATSDLVFVSGDILWGANLLSGSLSAYSATTGEYLQTISCPAYPYSVLHMPEPTVALAALAGLALTRVRLRRPAIV